MKKWQKILFIPLILLITLFFSNSFASTNTIKRLQCKVVNKQSKNTECIYQVPQGNKTGKVYVTTNMPYALCSKSLCRVASEKARFANCACIIFGSKKRSWRNASLGPKPFNQSKPLTQNKKLMAVTSNFSLGNIFKDEKPTKTVCKSNKAMPWADCFGVRCKIQYRKIFGAEIPFAVCRCPISRTKVFSSLGVTNVSKCKPPKGRVWSAATNQQRKNNVAIMRDIYKKFYPKTAPN